MFSILRCVRQVFWYAVILLVDANVVLRLAKYRLSFACLCSALRHVFNLSLQLVLHYSDMFLLHERCQLMISWRIGTTFSHRVARDAANFRASLSSMTQCI